MKGMGYMGDAEKAISGIEKITGESVSWPTIIACVVVILAALLWIYKQIWPFFKERIDSNVSKRMKEKEEHDKVDAIEKKQQEQAEQFCEMVEMMKALTASVGQVSKQLDGISGENKLTLSVLLDMIECMQNKTSPEECAKLAQSNINTFYREGKLPAAMPN